MEPVDPLLQGLKLYEPKTFLFPENYLASLQTQPAHNALGFLIAGALLVCFALPFRRASAGLMLAGVLWTIGAATSMTTHMSFVLLTVPVAALGLALGLFTPRLAHALVAAVVLGVLVRALALIIDGEFALYAFLGGAALGFLIALVAWQSWVALLSSVVGGVFVGFSLAPLLGRKLDAAIAGGTATLVFFIGLVVQLRTGEITWERAKLWKPVAFLAAKLRRKPKKKPVAKAAAPAAKPADKAAEPAAAKKP